MPAGITVTDAMAYVGRKPWHNLGTHVEGEAMTALQAMEAANLNWEVQTQPVYAELNQYGSQSMTEIPDKKAVVRMDTQTVFTVVGNQYTPIQNSESFGFFDELVGDGDAVYHTVGSLFGGKKVWILAKINGSYKLDNGEDLESFILLDNSHDGSTSFKMRLTPVRVVCSNTLAVATASTASFTSRHTSGIKTKVSEARDLLGLNAVYMERFMEQCNEIASEAWDREYMNKLSYKLIAPDWSKEKGPNLSGTRQAAIQSMNSLYSNGVGNKGETRWDAFNAVTEFVDYHKGGRALDSFGATDEVTVSNRLSSAWFWDSAKMRDRAFDILSLPQEKLEVVLN